MVEGTTQKWGKLWIGIGVALVAGILLGVGVMALVNTAPSPQKTFTIIAHHWGFVIYDEARKEIPKIEVPVGTEVTLLVMGAEALNHDTHEAFVERTIEAWADNPDFGGKNTTEIYDLLEEAEVAGLEDHTVMITGYDLDVPAMADSPSPSIMTFIADEEGTFDIQCNNFCGWGHQFMTLEGGFVVA